MPELEIQHAKLIELKDDLSDVMPGGKSLAVQFNPESLKLSYANQIKEQPNASGGGGGAGRGGNQSQGSAARQFVGTGTTKLSVQLWFDADELPALRAAGLVAATAATTTAGRGAAAGVAAGVVLDLVGEAELQRLGVELHRDGLAAGQVVLQVLGQFDEQGLASVRISAHVTSLAAS